MRRSWSLLYKLSFLKLLVWCVSALASGVLLVRGQLAQPALLGLVLGLGAVMVFASFCLAWRNLWHERVSVFLLLLTEIALLSGVISLTGALINPFTSSLLVPVALGVALLPRRASAMLLAVAILIYGAWVATANDHHMMHHNFALHLYGMGVNFLVCALLLYIFVAAAVSDARGKEELIAKAREKIMRDEQLVGIASLTANTAHALGTPLQTMTIVVDDLEADTDISQKDVDILQSQLGVCRRYLRQLVQTASVAGGDESVVLSIPDLLDKIQAHYQLQIAKSPISFEAVNDDQRYGVQYSDSLFFALINLMDNSLRACEQGVQVHCAIQSSFWVLTIINDGERLPEGLALDQPKPFVTMASGLGLGMYLSNYTIEQNGGLLNINNGEIAGAITTVKLPVREL